MTNTRNHRRFCEHDGWELCKVTDHYYYRKVLPNGEVFRARVSLGNKQYSPALWAEIGNKQLRVTQEYFNSKICGK